LELRRVESLVGDVGRRRICRVRRFTSAGHVLAADAGVLRAEGPAVASDPLDPRCEAEEWKASWLLNWLWLLHFSTCRWGVPPNSVLLLDVLCTCVSARCEPRRLFRLLGPLGVRRAELSELLCDFAAWFSASPVSSSVVCSCSWLGVCSAAASRPGIRRIAA
jgi:hypothetical protein